MAKFKIGDVVKIKTHLDNNTDYWYVRRVTGLIAIGMTIQYQLEHLSGEMAYNQYEESLEPLMQPDIIFKEILNK